MHDFLRSSVALEAALGSPDVDDNPLSHTATMRCDEEESFPAEGCAYLREWGFFDFLVPNEAGGALHRFDELLWLTRVVSRRDLTVAIGVGQTLLGALPVWLAGTTSQQARASERIRSGDLGCLALTERDHGSDLLETETTAAQRSGGYDLTGQKWLINNGSRGRTVTVLARVESPGRVGLSLFFLDKDDLEHGAWLPMPKAHTLGIRGADISGIRFEGARIDTSSQIGRTGSGLSIVAKALQVSRTLCAGFSLGAADTCLRIATEFAEQRRLYGAAALELPTVRHELARAYVDLLAAEALSIAGARSLHAKPAEMSLVSAVIKYRVPTLCEDIVQASARVLGARHFLRETHRSGIFQKMLRDNSVVSLFDGSLGVNLSIVAGQLAPLAAARATRSDVETECGFLDLVGTPVEAMPSVSTLALTNAGRDSLVSELIATVPAIEAMAVYSELSGLLSRMLSHLQAIDGTASGCSGRKDAQDRRVLIGAAHRYCEIVLASACVLVWWHNRSGPSDVSDPIWVVAALNRILARLEGTEPLAPARTDILYEAALVRLRRRVGEGRLISLLDLELGVGAAASASMSRPGP